MSSLSWHWCNFELPPKWEVTGYSAGSAKGSMQLYTREGFVGELSWRKTKRVPDQRRIMAEIHRRHLQDQTGEKDTPTPSLTFKKVTGFQVGFHKNGELFQASHFQKETQVLLEWVFPQWQKELYDSQIRPMLKSYRPNHGEQLRWSIFGIDLTLPNTFLLEELSPLPGHTVIEWATKKRMHFSVRRWALPEELLGHMNLLDFGRHLCRKLFRKVVDVAPIKVRGHDGARVEFSMKGQVGLERIVGQWWDGEILIWWDREAKRICALEQFGPKRQPRVELKDVWKW